MELIWSLYGRRAGGTYPALSAILRFQYRQPVADPSLWIQRHQDRTGRADSRIITVGIGLGDHKHEYNVPFIERDRAHSTLYPQAKDLIVLESEDHLGAHEWRMPLAPSNVSRVGN